MRKIGRYLLCYMLMAVLVLGNQDLFVRADSQPEGAAQKEGVKAEQRQNTPYSGLMPSVGDIRVLVFLVDFPDLEKGEKCDYGDELSVYYKTASYGLLNIAADIPGFYTAKHESTYYEALGSEGRQELLKEIMEYHDTDINYEEYDADKDGIIDGIYIDCYVRSKEVIGKKDFWSACTSRLSETDCRLAYDNVQVNGYAWLSGIAFYRQAQHIMEYIHQTGHLLGLKDYFNNITGHTEGGIGTFDIMCTYEGDMNAFSKITLGWIKPKVVSGNENITLRTSQLYPEAAVVYPNGDTTSDQYFLLEYVTASGVNDKNWSLGSGTITTHLECIGDGGLRVWRINAALNDSGTDYRYQNTLNSRRLIEAVGVRTREGFWEGCGNYAEARTVNGKDVPNLYFDGDELTPYTTPSSYIYADAATDYHGPFETSGLSVKNIKIHKNAYRDFESAYATASISFDQVEQKKFAYTAEYQVDNFLFVMLGFDYETTIIDSGKIYVRDEKGKSLPIFANIENAVNDGFKKLCITSEDEYISLDRDTGIFSRDTGPYTLIVEEGALQNVTGVCNPRIEIAMQTSEAERFSSKEIDVADYSSYSEIVKGKNGHSYGLFGNKDGFLSFVDFSEKNGQVSYNIRQLSVPYYSGEVKIAANNTDIFFGVKNEEGKYDLYEMDEGGNYRLLAQANATWIRGFWANNSKCIWRESTGDTYFLDIQTGTVLSWMAFTGLDNSKSDFIVNVYGNNIIMFSLREGIRILNENGDIISRISAEEWEDMFAAEEPRSALYDNHRVYIMTSECKVIIFDEKLNFIEQKNILGNSSYFQPGFRLGKVNFEKLDSGYACYFEASEHQQLRKYEYFKNRESCTEGKGSHRVMIFDDHFNYTASRFNNGIVTFGTVGNSLVYWDCGSIFGSEAIDFSGASEREAAELKLDKSRVTIKRGTGFGLKAALYPYNASSTVTWTSSDERIATVNQNGYVHGVADGTAAITARYGDKEISCIVTVVHTHSYMMPAWNWSEDYAKAAATFQCTAGDDIQVKQADVTVQETPATDTEDGSRAYTAQTEWEGMQYTDVKEVVLPSPGHSYSSPTWQWASDYSSVEARFDCIECGKGETVQGEVESSVTEASCTQDGLRKYTAKVQWHGEAYETTEISNEVVYPATGHHYDVAWNWSGDNMKAAAIFQCTAGDDIQVRRVNVAVDETPATCTTDGKTVYTAQTEIGGTEYADKKEVVLTAAGHSYGAPIWNWSKDYTEATAAFICAAGDDRQTLQAEISSEIVEPTVTSEGRAAYTARVSFRGRTYSERKEVVLKKLDWPDAPVVAVLYGDVDGDGYITTDDALAVLQYIAGKNPPRFIKEAADCDRSGFITPDDALRILQYVAGKIREI